MKYSTIHSARKGPSAMSFRGSLCALIACLAFARVGDAQPPPALIGLEAMPCTSVSTPTTVKGPPGHVHLRWWTDERVKGTVPRYPRREIAALPEGVIWHVERAEGDGEFWPIVSLHDNPSATNTAFVRAPAGKTWRFAVYGVFLGFVEGGTVAVRLDGDDLVRECRPGMLRLGGPPFPEPADDAVPVAEQDEEKPVLDAGETPDWEAVPVGTVVYLDLNGETAEGKLVGYEDDVVSVDVDGTVRRVPADDVFLTV